LASPYVLGTLCIEVHSGSVCSHSSIDFMSSGICSMFAGSL
jgi:hypothetical protein